MEQRQYENSQFPCLLEHPEKDENDSTHIWGPLYMDYITERKKD